DNFVNFPLKLTVVGGCIQGSPSICIGNVFLVLITTEEHCASLLPLALNPVLTCPICRQFSSPMTSINPSPISKNTTMKQPNQRPHPHKVRFFILIRAKSLNC